MDGFIKDNKLIHYGKNISARVLDTKAKTLGTFMLDTNIEMKVSETLKEIERHIVYAATNKQNKINPTEVVNNDFEESMLNEKTEDLLNFKGIEGWTAIINKIKKNKAPTEIKILRVTCTMLLLVMLTGMGVFYYFSYQNYSYIDILNQIQNLTTNHDYYLIDSVIKAEKINSWNNITEIPKSFNASVSSNSYNLYKLYTNTFNMKYVIDDLRNIKMLTDGNFTFFRNDKEFLIFNDTLGVALVPMSLIEYCLQLINKLLSFGFDITNQKLLRTQADYKAFFINSMTVYLQGTEQTMIDIEKVILINILNFMLKFFFNYILTLIFQN